MAIEPLSSAMTYQAQNTQQARPVHKTAENTDVSTTVEQTVNFDPTTAKIKEVDEKNGQEPRPIIRVLPNSRQQVMNRSGRLSNSSNKNMSHSEAVFRIHGQRTVLRSRL